MAAPPSSANFVDGRKNPSQQRGSLPVPQVPIRLTTIWYGMAGLTGLWTRYHLGGDLNRLSSTKKKEVPAGFILL